MKVVREVAWEVIPELAESWELIERDGRPHEQRRRDPIEEIAIMADHQHRAGDLSYYLERIQDGVDYIEARLDEAIALEWRVAGPHAGRQRSSWSSSPASQIPSWSPRLS